MDILSNHATTAARVQTTVNVNKTRRGAAQTFGVRPNVQTSRVCPPRCLQPPFRTTTAPESATWRWSSRWQCARERTSWAGKSHIVVCYISCKPPRPHPFQLFRLRHINTARCPLVDSRTSCYEPRMFDGKCSDIYQIFHGRM